MHLISFWMHPLFLTYHSPTTISVNSLWSVYCTINYWHIYFVFNTREKSDKFHKLCLGKIVLIVFILNLLWQRRPSSSLIIMIKNYYAVKSSALKYCYLFADKRRSHNIVISLNSWKGNWSNNIRLKNRKDCARSLYCAFIHS